MGGLLLFNVGVSGRRKNKPGEPVPCQPAPGEPTPDEQDPGFDESDESDVLWSLIYPGTKWCGAGEKEIFSHYTQI